ncbi:MAG: 3'-5' exoribonuclease YhaM family protein [Phycisphaerae bacterium]
MARRYICELKPGERLENEVFAIRSKDLRTTTQGSLYVHAILTDRTGEIVARQWQATEDGFNSMPEGGFMRFKGRVENYKGNVQFIIDAMGQAEPGSFDLDDFLARSNEDPEKMWARVVEILQTQINHPDVAALIAEFLADTELMTKFRRAPAAVLMHHAYVGGLLEHTLSVLELAVRTIPLYPKLSLDLVLAGVFLHDIGKSAELVYEAAIGYTDSGQLLGHITQAVVWIEQKADAAASKRGRPFPNEIRWALQHIVLSHHGYHEFGSPKLPAIPEALAVHYLDNLDAKVTMFLSEIENHRDPSSHWTKYHRALETKIYAHDIMGVRSS